MHIDGDNLAAKSVVDGQGQLTPEYMGLLDYIVSSLSGIIECLGANQVNNPGNALAGGVYLGHV